MTKVYPHPTILLGLISALMLALMAGCAPHADIAKTPTGTTMGEPLTQEQIKVLDQQRAAKGTKPGP